MSTHDLVYAPDAGIEIRPYLHDAPEQQSALTQQMRKRYAPGVPSEIPINDDLLVDSLEATVGKYPQRIALDFFGATLSYTQLRKRIAQCAAMLRASGVSPGSRVAIILPNCPQFVVAMYATLQLGAVASLQNPLASPKEMASQLKECSPKVIITWEKAYELIPEELLGAGTKIFAVNLVSAMPFAKRLALKLPLPKARELHQSLRTVLPSTIADFDVSVNRFAPYFSLYRQHPDAPALLLHTGGTTGVPKSVILTNRNLVTNSEANASWVTQLREGEETWFCVLPFFHAFGLNLTLSAMIRMGATAVLFPKFDVDMVLSAQKRRPCTFILGVPPMFDRLTKAAKTAGVSLASIRYAISGAMPLSGEVAAAWEEITSGFVVEGYGMTETSPTILGSPFSPQRRPGTLGLVFPSIQIRIVDPDDPTKDVPEGQVGELIVKGPGCSPGYWCNPEETKELFTAEGWMRSGDLVYLDDGFVVMADRRKELIITNGFNVYPSQVEDAVRNMPGVRDVAVIGVPDSEDAARGEEVQAVFVLEDGAKIDLETVRKWAEKTISHYALPRSISVLTELPYSQLGKVMRRKVRDVITGLQNSEENREKKQ